MRLSGPAMKGSGDDATGRPKTGLLVALTLPTPGAAQPSRANKDCPRAYLGSLTHPSVPATVDPSSPQDVNVNNPAVNT